MAALHQAFQRGFHRLHFTNFVIQFGNVFQRQRLDLAAGTRLILPQTEQGADLFDGKAQIARLFDESQRVHFGVGIGAIARFGTRRFADQTNFFVMPDHFGRYARGLRGTPDIACGRRHFTLPACGRQRRSSSALDTTLKLLNAIAAPAMTGLSRPNAASGMPTTL